jgi:hypothetical protein
MKQLDVSSFLIFSIPFALAISLVAFAAWRGKLVPRRRGSTKVLTKEMPLTSSQMKVQASAMPSISVMIWSIIPSCLFLHGADISKGLSRILLETAATICEVGFVIFFIFSFSTLIIRKPQFMVPPSIRS